MIPSLARSDNGAQRRFRSKIGRPFALTLLLLLGAAGTAGLAEETRGVDRADSLSTLVYRWAKALTPEESLNLYGKGGLLERTLALNPEIKDSNRIFPGQRIRLPAHGGQPTQTLTAGEIRGDDLPSRVSKPPQVSESLPTEEALPSSFRSWGGVFRIGGGLGESRENISNVVVDAKPRSFAPIAEVGLRFQTQPQSNTIGTNWEARLDAGFQSNLDGAGLDFPLTFDLNALFFRKGLGRTTLGFLPGGVGLGGGVQWQQFAGATLDLSVATSTTRTLVRNTQALWGALELEIPLEEQSRPGWAVALLAGRSLTTSSTASTVAASLGPLSGWKYGARLAGHFGRWIRPLGFEVRAETVKLSEKASPSNFFQQSIVSGFLTVSF